MDQIRNQACILEGKKKKKMKKNHVTDTILGYEPLRGRQKGKD